MARTLNPVESCCSTGKTYIGVDNGVSGSIGIIPHHGADPCFHLTPTESHLSYTKEAKNITRINWNELTELLKPVSCPFAILERPMVNPQRFQASASALRALEATLIVLESLQIPYRYVDSKEWQKDMLPKGVKGEALKTASLNIGQRLFPQFKFKGDADGILIAEWARRKGL